MVKYASTCIKLFQFVFGSCTHLHALLHNMFIFSLCYFVQPLCSQRSISGCFSSEQVLLDAQKAELPRAEREAKEASRFPSLGNNASWASLFEFDYCSCITCAVSLLISQVKRMLAVAELLILHSHVQSCNELPWSTASSLNVPSTTTVNPHCSPRCPRSRSPDPTRGTACCEDVAWCWAYFTTDFTTVGFEALTPVMFQACTFAAWMPGMYSQVTRVRTEIKVHQCRATT